MMFLLMHLLLWIPVTFVKSECLFFPRKFLCTNINQYDFKYQFYKNQHYLYEYSAGKILSNYEIEILNSNYTVIDKIVNPPIQDIDVEVTKLKINNCSVKYVQEDAFQKLGNLIHLDLSWNKIEDTSFVEYLPSAVEYLDLSYNKIKVIDFTELNVLHFNFSHNFITKLIPAESEKIYQKADLSNNQISEYDESKLKCNFHFLRLNYNVLTTVLLKNFQSIDVSPYTVVELRGNTISHISSVIPHKIHNLDLTHSIFNITNTLFINQFFTDKLIMSNSEISVLNNDVINLIDIRRYGGYYWTHKPMLDFSNSSIKDIDRYYFKDMSCDLLNISHNNLQKIRDGVFRKSYLYILDISSSNIEYIENGAFFNLQSNEIYLHKNKLKTTANICDSVTVKKLDLSYNLIETLGNNSFSSCYYLQHLILCNSLISKIEPLAFNDLNHLAILDLRNNKLAVFEVNYIHTLHINTLQIQGNKIETIEYGAFYDLNNLITLNLSHSEISVIGSGAFSNLDSLKAIDLSNNSLKTIENNTFSGLPVRGIKLDNNRIEVIEYKAFNNLPYLQALHLSNYGIISVKSYAFSNMERIEIIDLRNNKLEILESNTFFNLAVENIKLEGNSITHIKGKAFNNLFKLRLLNLSGIGINYLEGNSFSDLAIVEIIDLSNNNLTTIETEAFHNLPVTTLELQGNKIKRIKSHAFSYLHHIKELNFSGYGIGDLEPMAFSYLSEIEVIDLSHNLISTLPADAFYEMDKINRIYLEGNFLLNLHPFDDSLRLKLITITFAGTFKPKIISNIYLRKLFFINSEIDALQNNCFIGLYNLNELHFTNSDIYSVENDSLSGLFNLIYLDSQTLFKHTNSMKTGMFKDLKRLDRLNLSNLELKILEPEAFLGLENLNTLLLENNLLQGISANIFKNLTNLSELYLNNNNISKIIPFSFDLDTLLKLFLKNNSLSIIEMGTFYGLKSLQELDLQYNRIELLPDYAFADLSNLKTLYLNNNRISRLAAHCFHGLGALTKLFLQNNHLINISSNVVYGLNKLEQLHLNNNSITLIYIDTTFPNLDSLKLLNI